MGEVLQAAGILNLLKNSLKNTKYFSHSYYLFFILSKLKEAKLNYFVIMNVHLSSASFTVIRNRKPDSHLRVHDYIFQDLI